MNTRHVCVSRLFALRREVCSSCVEIISLVLTCTCTTFYEGEATSMFENNSTSIGYTQTCSEIRII